MQIVVRDSNLRRLTALNNKVKGMLSFTNDTWHRYLAEATSTFDLTIPKFYNGRLHEDLVYITDKVYLSFRYQGEDHLFYVAQMVEDDFQIQLTCNNTSLELINELANPFTSSEAHTMDWYIRQMELLVFDGGEIGVFEVSDTKRTLTFENQETKLARLLSLASHFDAEIKFVTELNRDGSYKRMVLHIYHKADDSHHGVGRIRNDVILRYGKDVKGIQVTTDKTDLFTMGVFTGADGVNLNDLERSDKDELGNEEFYTRKGTSEVYAPKAAQMYGSGVASLTDKWIRRDYQTEYTNANDLLAYAFRTLKQYAYPKMTYTATIQSNFVNSYSDLALGDTVKIQDENFVNGLILQARVSEQVISFSNPNNNTLTFSNYVKLKSQLSSSLSARMQEMIDKKVPYTIQVATTNGTAFKNHTGESVITPTLKKGDKVITADVTYRFSLDGNVVTGSFYVARGSEVEDTTILTIAAYIGNDEVAVDEVTLVNVNDGANGQKGDRGEKGEKGDRGPKGDRGSDGIAGKDGVGIHATAISYAIGETGTTAPTNGWTAQVPKLIKGKYLWTRTIWTYTDTTSETGYSATYIAKDGNNGNDGIAGKDGVGISDTTITYAKATSGTTAPTTGWTSQVPSVPAGQYLWTKTVWTYTDNTTETSYSVAKMGDTGAKGDKGDKGDRGAQGERGPQGIQGLQGPKGDQGIAGAKGADGRTQYTHIAYADNATGGGFSQTDQTKAYIGMYQDFNATDSNNPTAYRWTKWRGSDGAQGIPGKAGADGRTPYFHRAWANSANGRDGFSTSDSTNKRYLGTLTDFTEADSQDPSQYKWTALFDNVQIGGRNLLRGTKEMLVGSGTWSSGTFRKSGTGTIENVDITDSPIPSISKGIKLTSGATTGEIGIAQDGFYLQADWVTLTYYVKGTVGQIVQLQPFWNPSNNSGSDRNSLTLDGSWQKISFSIKNTKAGNYSIGYIYLINKAVGNSVTVIAGFEEYATNGSDWQTAPEDIEDNLNSKADQVLTQEQINALNERAGLIQAEMEAKAAMDTVTKWFAGYQQFVEDQKAGMQRSNNDIVTLSQRVNAIDTNLGSMAQRWSFIDSYMKAGNEGLVIGKNDGSSSVRISDKRISFCSAGQEVAYISNGVLQIDNGVFTKTLQIGRFREEQYHSNLDMNVMRYVGG